MMDARDTPEAKAALEEAETRYQLALKYPGLSYAAAAAKEEAEAAALAAKPQPITHNPVCALYSVHDVLASQFNFSASYKNISILDPNCNFHITRNKASDMHLFYLQNIIYSFLVPDIRIFKVVREKREVADASKVGNLTIKDVVEIEFPRSLSHVRRIGGNEGFFAGPVVDREGQIGIKSFNWNYIGNDSYTAERDIEADLTLTMDGLGALFVPRTNWQGKPYVIADILLQSDCFKTSKEQSASTPQEFKNNYTPQATTAAMAYRPECYEILIEAGWRVDLEMLKQNIAENDLANYSIFKGDRSAESILKEISKLDFERMKSCMYLTPIDHTFNIKEDGSTECNITYRARLSQAMRDAQANILMDGKKKKAINNVQKEIDRLSKTSSKNETDKNELKAKQEEKKKLIEAAANSFGEDVHKILQEGGKIKTFAMNENTIKFYKQFLAEPNEVNWYLYRFYAANGIANVATESQEEAPPPTQREPQHNFSVPGRADDWRDATSAREERADFQRLLASEKLITSINYFYFADLIDAVMQFAGTDNFDNYRLVLGSVESIYLSDFSQKKKVSLASIPISEEMFQNFVTKQIQQPSTPSMSITKFVDLFITHMLPESLGLQCYDQLFPEREEIKLRNTQLVHYQNGKNPDPTKPNETTNLLDCEFMVRISSGCSDLVQDASKPENSFLPPLLISVVHHERSSDFVTGLGDIYKDFDKRIPHFKFGQAYGLIKKVSLQKTDLPYQREHRFTMSGGDRFTLLTNVYNATFEMIGNDLNTLGGFIYLDPDSLAPSGILGNPNDPESFAYIMGLGGAHLITKISHRMSPGKYDTTVQTVWENRGQLKLDKDKEDAEQAPAGNSTTT